MTIKVNIPVSYIVHGYLPGRRQPRSYLYAEIMPLEIEEVSSAEAPVAVEWSKGKLSETTMIGLVTNTHPAVDNFDSDGRQHTVFRNGRHWVRVLENNARYEPGNMAIPIKTSGAISKIEKGDFSRFFGFSERTMGQKEFNLVTGDPSDQFESVSRNLREQAMRQFDDLELLSVDGNLYMACGQPCHVMIPGWLVEDQTHICRVPLVDVSAHRSPRSMAWNRLTYVPLSATDIVAEAVRGLPSQVSALIAEPVIRIQESISREEDMRVLADYYVHEFMAQSFAKLHKPFAPTERYFDMATAEDKATYLANQEQAWAADCEQLNLPVEYLHLAMEVLDERSFEFAPSATPFSGLGL